MSDQQTIESETFWLAYRPAKSAEYYDSWNEAWRDDLIDTLHKFSPFSSILEVGCNSGPNYRRLVAAFGKVNYSGLDINKDSLKYLSERAPELELYCCSVLSITPDKKFDLVFCSSLLSLISPSDINLAIGNMISLSSRLIVIQEPQHEMHNGIFHQWSHNYLELTKKYTGFDWKVINKILVGVRS